MSSENERRPIAGISVGDLNGIGMEIILKSLEDDRILDLMTPVLFGSARAMNFYKKQLALPDYNSFVAKQLDKIKVGVVNLFPCWEEQVNIEPGKPDAGMATYALNSLDMGCKALEEKAIDFLVTAPIDKALIASAHEGFTGHTGYLAERFEGDALMILCAEEFRVALVTGHIPLAEVASTLTIEGIMQKLSQLNRSLRLDFGVQKPRIAVLGLNPHNGDQGLIGREEIEIIQPAVERAFGQEILAFGPYSPDGFFGSGQYRDFDAVLAMYHDQGLIPFKMMGMEHGVNFTAGLSIVRTSPDHGTAFDIAGKGGADERSFREALYLGREIFMKRRVHESVAENPLSFSKRSGRDA